MACGHQLDLRDRNLVQPWFYQAENGREEIGRIDDVKLAHALRVVILAYPGSLEHIVFDGRKAHQLNIVEVKDRTARFDWMSDLGRGGGKALGKETLVFNNQALEEAFFCRYLV